uniref:VWFA domain-containing protein n=1 Tax=viral metagenome TaxID=1070528 RepID=A0A6C0EKR0_9ZZZZ
MAAIKQLKINCPILHTPITEPVVTPGGHTYEGSAIREWIGKNGVSPLTRERVTLEQLKPNFALLDDMDTEEDDVQLPTVDYQLGVVKYEGKEGMAVEITPPDNVDGMPVSMVLAIDVSGSMDSLVKAKQTDGSEKCDGLTQLDITKHGAITVIQNMRSCDRLGIVAYSDRGQVIFPLEFMTTASKKRAEVAVRSLRTVGMTNMYDGIYKSLELLKDVNDSYRVVKLLSDGLPNVDPPSGHLNALKRLREKYGSLPVIDTFGFGYQLDSKLMHDISSYTEGSFSFIPDGTMVGTIFINDCANTLSIVAEGVSVHVTGNECKWLGGYPSDDRAPNGTTIIHLGSMRVGQKKGLWLKPNGEVNICVTYNNHTVDEIVTARLENHNNHTYNRSKAVDVLNIASLLARSKCWDQATQMLENPFTATECRDKYIADLATDLTVQATQAVSRSDWFERWGRHYLLSLSDAHAQCLCNNFKDPGVQHYGGVTFAQLRQKCEDTFLGIDPPKPTGRGYQHSAPISSLAFASSYHSSDGPCMTPDTRVHINENDTIALDDLKKGDTVWTPQGYDKVRCIVRTKWCHASIVRLGDGLKITEWHPVKVKGEWEFPCHVGTVEEYKGDIISIVLNSHPSIWLGEKEPYEVICLGHGCRGKVVGHPYFGTRAIIRDLSRMKGWNEGLVLLKYGCVRTDPNTGMVNGLVQEV